MPNCAVFQRAAAVVKKTCLVPFKWQEHLPIAADFSNWIIHIVIIQASQWHLCSVSILSPRVWFGKKWRTRRFGVPFFIHSPWMQAALARWSWSICIFRELRYRVPCFLYISRRAPPICLCCQNTARHETTTKRRDFFLGNLTHPYYVPRCKSKSIFPVSR